MSENVFEREWRECLEAHYMHVVRTDDRVTLPSLTYVMHQAGFDDAQLAELRVRATMHIDDVGADFVPDMNVLDAAPPPADEPRVFAVPEGVPASEDEKHSPQRHREAQSENREEVTAIDLTPDEALDHDIALTDAEVEGVPPEGELLPEAKAEQDEQDEVVEADPDAPQQLSLF
jgi:hypothetical protein